MTKAIIDPSTLTEEQRVAILREYIKSINIEGLDFDDEMIQFGKQILLECLFGEEFFKGE